MMDFEDRAGAAGGTEEDRARLKEALEAGASPGEVEEFIRRNKHCLDSVCEALIRRLTPTDQRHVMRRGDLPSDCCEPVICKRLKESKDMANQLSNIVAQSARRARQQAEREKEPKVVEQITFLPGYELNRAISMCEVSASESRFAGAAGGSAAPPPRPKKIETKEGTVCGVGGVIEVTKKKFGCDPGTRLQVLGDKGNLWQCEGGHSIVKFQKEGWRWVLRADIAAAEEEARRQKARKDQQGRAELERLAKDGEARRQDGRWRAILVLQERELRLARETDQRLRKEAQGLEERVEKELKEAKAREAQEAQEAREQAAQAAAQAAAKAGKKKEAKEKATKEGAKKKEKEEKETQKSKAKEKESKRKASPAASPPPAEKERKDKKKDKEKKGAKAAARPKSSEASEASPSVKRKKKEPKEKEGKKAGGKKQPTEKKRKTSDDSS